MGNRVLPYTLAAQQITPSIKFIIDDYPKSCTAHTYALHHVPLQRPHRYVCMYRKSERSYCLMVVRQSCLQLHVCVCLCVYVGLNKDSTQVFSQFSFASFNFRFSCSYLNECVLCTHQFNATANEYTCCWACVSKTKMNNSHVFVNIRLPIGSFTLDWWQPNEKSIILDVKQPIKNANYYILNRHM